MPAKIGIQWGGNTFMMPHMANPQVWFSLTNVRYRWRADDGSSPLSVSGSRSPNGRSAGGPIRIRGQHACPAGLATGKCHRPHHGSVAGAFNLNLRLSAMESTGNGSHPVLAAHHHHGQHRCHDRTGRVSIPSPLVSAMGAMTQFVDAKLHLGVKPHVTQ